MDNAYQAFSEASQVWEGTIAHLGWQHGVMAVAYFLAATLCLMNAQVARQTGDTGRRWLATAAALLFLGANTLLHVDLFLTQLLRSSAHLQGWYEQRRPLQYAMALLLFALIWRRARRPEFSTLSRVPSTHAWGLSLLLLLFAFRTVSAHGIDAVTELRLAGVSLGRLLELAGLGLVLQGAKRSLELR